MATVKRLILDSPPLQFIFRIADRITLPGFEGFSLYEIGRFFFNGIRNVKLNERVAASTYNFLMAIPPTLLFLFSLLPSLLPNNIDNTRMIINDTLGLVITSPDVNKSVNDLLESFMKKGTGSVLSFGILLTLFFSSNGMMGLMRSFDRSFEQNTVLKKRTGLRRRWTAIKLTVMLMFVILLSLAVLLLQGQYVEPIIKQYVASATALRAISILLLMLVTFCTISIIYKFGPSLTHKFKFASVGSVFATLMIGVATTVFFFLVNNFLNYDKVYGSIGTLIAFMVWIWLNTLVLLLGYELNVSILLGKLTHKEHEKKLVRKRGPKQTRR